MILSKNLLVISFLFISSLSLAIEIPEEKHPLEDFSALSNAVPSEIVMMISHLKESELTEEQVKSILVTSELISKDLMKIPPANIMFLLKSEAYKGILTNQYLKQGSLLQVSSSVLKSAQSKLEKFSNIYSGFSKWLIQSFIKDFDPFLDKNFINEYQNLKRTNYDAQLKIKRLNKILKYHSAWLNVIDHYTPEDFNSLCTKIIVDTFERISKKSYYFKTFYGTVESSSNDPLFSIPKYEPKPAMAPLPEEDKSLKEEATERKEKAQEDVKGLETDDLSGLSSEIDKLEE